MPVEKLITAIVLGLSFERILFCPFIAISLSLSDRWGGLRFISGRLIGICLLGVVISAVGLPFRIPVGVLDGIFGFFLLILSAQTFLKTGHNRHGKGRFSQQASFGLGIFRGFLNPGRKIVYLLPLLWGVSIAEGLAISLLYALSSSVYLLIGFFSAELINKLTKYQKVIKIAGGIMLGIVGGFNIYKAFKGGS